MWKSRLGILLACLCAVSANAQWVGVYGSYWDTEDFGDAYGMGVLYQWPLNDRLAIEGRGTWYLDFGNREGEEIEPASIGIGPVIFASVSESWTAYASVIGSLYAYNRDVVVDGEEVVDDGGAELGFMLTGGLRTDVNATWDAFAEIHYSVLSVDTEGVRDGSIVDETLDFDGMGVNVGVGREW